MMIAGAKYIAVSIHSQGESRSAGVGVVGVESDRDIRAWVAQVDSDRTP